MAEGRVEGQDLPARRAVMRMMALSGVLILAGCQVVPKGPPKPVGPVPDGPATGLPSDASRHRIALLVPITGPNAAVGESIANAANMAVMDTGGKSVRVTVYDTAPGAMAAAERAVAEGNKLILGPLLAEDVRAASDVGRRAKVPLISFSNDVSIAGNGTYIIGFTPAQSVIRVVAYAKSKGATRFGALVPAGTYGQRASTALGNAVQASGGKLVSIQTYDRTPSSMLGAVARMNKAGVADAILIADAARTALQAVPTLRRGVNAKTRIMGTELWNTETALGSSTTLHGAWFASVSDTLYLQLANKYRTRFGKGPYRLASLGYDSVLLVNKVAQNWRVGTAFPQSTLSDRGGFTGIDGAFRFNQYGVAERALEVQQVAAGGATVVAVAPKSFD